MKEEKEIYKGSSHGPTRHGYGKPCSVFWSSLSAAVFLGELDFTVGIQLWHLIWNLHSELQALGLKNVITYDCVHLTLQSTLLFDTFILYFPERAPNILALEKYLLSKITNSLDAPLSAQMRRVTMNTSCLFTNHHNPSCRTFPGYHHFDFLPHSIPPDTEPMILPFYSLCHNSVHSSSFHGLMSSFPPFLGLHLILLDMNLRWLPTPHI